MCPCIFIPFERLQYNHRKIPENNITLGQAKILNKAQLWIKCQ
jgi:hypothetical protein